jgi:hypothetical protein
MIILFNDTFSTAQATTVNDELGWFALNGVVRHQAFHLEGLRETTDTSVGRSRFEHEICQILTSDVRPHGATNNSCAFLTTLFQLLKLYDFDDRTIWMINSKGRGRKWSRPILMYPSRKPGRVAKTTVVRSCKVGIRTTWFQVRFGWVEITIASFGNSNNQRHLQTECKNTYISWRHIRFKQKSTSLQTGWRLTKNTLKAAGTVRSKSVSRHVCTPYMNIFICEVMISAFIRTHSMSDWLVIWQACINCHVT